MGLCAHGKNIKHQRCYECEEIAEAEMRVEHRMSQKKETKEKLQTTGSINELLSHLELREEGVESYLLDQPKLFLQSAQYRISKVRAAKQAKAALEILEADVAQLIRAQARENDDKLTEKALGEHLSQTKKIQEARKVLDEAETAEEYSKLIMDSFRQRGDMLRSLVQLMGAEAAKEAGFVRAELERMGGDKIREQATKRFGG